MRREEETERRRAGEVFADRMAAAVPVYAAVATLATLGTLSVAAVGARAAAKLAGRVAAGVGGSVHGQRRARGLV
jgi:hypothetical protein